MDLLATRSRGTIAALAFLGHYPALRFVAGYRLNSRTARLNVVAGAATVAAMVGSWIWLGALGAFVAWVVGHFAWSTILATRVYRGEAGGWA